MAYGFPYENELRFISSPTKDTKSSMIDLKLNSTLGQPPRARFAHRKEGRKLFSAYIELQASETIHSWDS
jgi:hypothetical protein